MTDLFDLPQVENADGKGIAIDKIKESLSKEQYSKFNNWFSGKTGGITQKGIFFVWIWDWEQFLQNELGILE